MSDFRTQIVELKLNFRKARQLSVELQIDVLDLPLHNRWQPQVRSCRTRLARRLDGRRRRTGTHPS